MVASTLRKEKLPTHVLLQPSQQADLSAKVLGGVEDQGLIRVAQEIKRINATRGKKQVAQKKLLKPIDSHLRSARQTVTLGTGVISWAIFDDVLEAIRVNAHRSSDKETQALAQAEWEDKYFKLDLYAIGGEQLTAAEAIGLWTRKGYSWRECKDYLYKKFWPPTGEKRQLDEQWRRERRQRYQERSTAIVAMSDAVGRGTRARTSSAEWFYCPWLGGRW